MRIKKYNLLILNCIIGILLLAGPGVASAGDITGWGKVQWGTTLAEVEKLYPLGPWERKQVDERRLKHEVEINGNSFVVSMVFLGREPDSRIESVTLSDFGPSDYSWLSDWVENRYGPSDSTSYANNDNTVETIWHRDSGAIKMIIHKTRIADSVVILQFMSY